MLLLILNVWLCVCQCLSSKTKFIGEAADVFHDPFCFGFCSKPWGRQVSAKHVKFSYLNVFFTSFIYLSLPSLCQALRVAFLHCYESCHHSTIRWHSPFLLVSNAESEDEKKNKQKNNVCFKVKSAFWLMIQKFSLMVIISLGQINIQMILTDNSCFLWKIIYLNQ